MAKNTTPVITHTEILARAISSIEAEISDWRTKCSAHPDAQVLFNSATEELTRKLDSLKTLYRIETGSEY